jgi:hypothetical protein
MFFLSLRVYFATMSLISLSSSFQLCPLLGSTVPIATSLLQSTTFQQTLQNLTASLDRGIEAQLGVNSSTTSYSVSIFSTSANSTPSGEPFLWQYHHTAPSLADAVSGVKTVDADSIYRIGSLTKVFTILSFLLNAGDTYWDQPITKFVPELAAANSLNAGQNSIDSVDWEGITIGNLASHMSGIGRDCKIF